MMDHCGHVTHAHAMSEGHLARRYVAYYRVSTIQQGQFGFGIEAQRAAAGGVAYATVQRNFGRRMKLQWQVKRSTRTCPE
jgi:hypothetical protein